MSRALLRKRDWLLLALGAVGCADSGPRPRPVAALTETVSAPVNSATVGTSAGTWSVRVQDASGQPLPDVAVTFAVALGGGSSNPRVDTTGADGIASTELVLGAVPGQNQLSASVAGVALLKSPSVTGIAGPVAKVVITPGPLRFGATRNVLGVGALTRDAFGNVAGPNVTWQSRNPSLVSVTPQPGNNAAVNVVSRPGQTWLVASVGSAVDSVTVFVLDANSSHCAFMASPVTLAVGETASFNAAGVMCVHANAPGSEYAVVTHYSAAASSALLNGDIIGIGVTAPSTAWPAEVAEPAVAPVESAGTTAGFETELRAREERELAARSADARAWYARRPATSLVATARVGDQTSINVNSSDFCVRPDVRSMRVAAITNTAVILADNENPAGGFTDEEYREFGLAMDTLVYGVDTAAFGVPTDIDGNERVVIAFTRAVNELTPRGSTSGIALGFFFSRDLLPKQGVSSTCPGSNAAEMFYVLVPDPGAVAGDARPKAFVQSVAVSTIAHELQHLINTSRRLYVNRTAAATEELWLNEGLSHIAEELVFYRASGLAPRQNIDAGQLQPGSNARALFDMYVRGNFGRYLSYLRSPELNSPISSDDFLATRGATWAFLRFVADKAGPTDGTLWRRLANGERTGLANLEDQLAGTGLTTLGLLRDWSVAVLSDDAIAGGSAPAQPSWNFVSAMPAVGMSFGLTPGALLTDVSFALAIRAGGSAYWRFAVPENREALLLVRGISGAAVPSGARLTVVRTR